MMKYFKGTFWCFLCLFVFSFSSFTLAQEQDNINLSVTVDNSMHEIPGTPVIIRDENLATHSVDLVVEVENIFTNEELDFVVTATNVDTGDITNFTYDQAVDGVSQTTLNVNSLVPGTEYDFTVRYSRDGVGIYSADSDSHTVITLIDPPILDSIENVDTDSLTLEVVVDPAFAGSAMDFIVEVTNEDTGDDYTVQMTENVTSSSVSLDINDLDPGTEYSFRVRYAREDTGRFSDYSNGESATTDLEAPAINDIVNITTSSMDVVVEVNEAFDGENMDFVVHVTNKDTGDTFEVDFTEKVKNDSTATLTVDGLDAGTEYEFKVKYAREGSSVFSDYSSSQSAWTEEDGGDKKVTVCHNGETILININTLDIHLAHGDYEGPCVETEGIGGPYTSQKTGPGEIVSGGAAEVVDEEEADDEMQKEEMRETIIPEERKASFQTAAAVGAVAGSAMALAGSAVPLFSAMPGAFSSSVFLKFIELLGILGRRKQERSWGVVFDTVTHMPIQAAKIILSDESGKELATTYSDRDGRFGFLADPGKYMVDIFKKDYELVTDKEKDDLYGNVYSSGMLEIGHDRVVLTNIAMKSTEVNWEEYAEKKINQYTSAFSKFKKYFFLAIYIVGFGSTAILTYFYPSTFNFVVLGIYVTMFIYQTFFKKKKYGMIETDNGKPVPFAVVSLHDDISSEKKGFAVTDAIGRYYLLADNGEYKMRAKGQPVSGESFEKQGDVRVNDGIVRKDIVV